MQEVIQILTKLNKTIATMESCTGGGVANAITNIEGASEVLKYSAVTYSNEYKIKMGVNQKTINKYSVYSMEVAREMAENISNFANSNYGIGITGKLNRVDVNNPFGEDNVTFISIYDKYCVKERLEKGAVVLCAPHSRQRSLRRRRCDVRQPLHDGSRRHLRLEQRIQHTMGLVGL